ncbi:hypothetical protein [Bacillus dakarensis]|uniref:hypothetical protein n=1 Tax=Robertmurraya dakarensis TaxID=1926278 RepID=UPI000981F8C0|nr:hypothetical protein [Bacillus dakarensis]
MDLIKEAALDYYQSSSQIKDEPDLLLQLRRLRFSRFGKKIFIQDRLPFKFEPNVILKEKYIKEAFEFSYNMTYGRMGAHRITRSGGQMSRSLSDIFKDTFQGKLGEFAVYQFLTNYGIECTAPDLEVLPLGYWDEYDLKAGSELISVKTTKGNGTLLLLETDHYNKDGAYTAVPENETPVLYDYFCFVRIMMNRKIHEEDIKYKSFQQFMSNQVFHIQITGFLNHHTFANCVIKESFVIPQGAYITENIKMDVENFYVQAADLLGIEEFIARMKSNSHYN